MKMPLTDNQLMQMFADHDDDVAFERLYHKYKDALIRFSYGYTFNQAKAEEIAHDTFLKVYRYKKKYDPEKTFRTWLWTICKNTNLDALDKNPVRREESLDQIHLDIVDVDEDALTKLISVATKEEIAEVMVFLASDSARGVNGNIMFVDGGTDALLNSEKVY